MASTSAFVIGLGASDADEADAVVEGGGAAGANGAVEPDGETLALGGGAAELEAGAEGVGAAGAALALFPKIA